jgi:putative phage-type endonuclease
MEVISIEIGSEQWHRLRAKSIGASESAAILNLSPFTTAYQLWEQKILGTTTQSNPSMRRGLELEPAALAWVNEELSSDMQPKMIQSSEYPWKIATLDGFSSDGKVAVEIKHANLAVHQLARAGKAIDYYSTQLQSQMICAECDSMYFLSCYEVDGVMERVLVEVQRDEELCAKILEAEKIFYYEHMLKEVPPPLTERDYAVVGDTVMFDIACDYEKQYKKQIAELKKEMERIESKRSENKEQLIYLSMDRNCKSEQFSFTKTTVLGRVDYESIPELKGVDLSKYRKESTVRWRVNEL